MGDIPFKPSARSLKWAATLLVVLLLAASVTLAPNWADALPGMALKAVDIGGAKSASAESLQAAAETAARGNFFTVDVRHVGEELKSVAWVRAATVRRVWPDRLAVTLEEHVPLARWRTVPGAMDDLGLMDDLLINTHGEVFRAEYSGDLPRFIGPPGSEREVSDAYREFGATLQEANLQVAEITLSPRRAWQVKLSSGMVLELGRVRTQERLARFVAVSRQLPELRERPGRADLRYSNGLALKVIAPRAKTGKTPTKK